MRLILFCFVMSAALSGCSDVETIENKDENGVLQERYTRKKDNFDKHGTYTSFHPNGQVYEERQYQNNALNGQSKVYTEDGQLDYVENHVNGQFEGIYQQYHANGQLSNEGQYVKNEMSGIWKRWYDDGTLREEVPFAGNNENGSFKEYHPNGNLKTEGVYTEGDNEQGELMIYDEDGVLVEKKICEFGICGTTWRKDEGDLEVDMERVKKLAAMKKLSMKE